jgi:hypothetical protein
MAMSREDISLLYDHDESLTEEQLRREIEHLNAELGKFKVREYRRSTYKRLISSLDMAISIYYDTKLISNRSHRCPPICSV